MPATGASDLRATAGGSDSVLHATAVCEAAERHLVKSEQAERQPAIIDAVLAGALFRPARD